MICYRWMTDNLLRKFCVLVIAIVVDSLFSFKRAGGGRDSCEIHEKARINRLVPSLLWVSITHRGKRIVEALFFFFVRPTNWYLKKYCSGKIDPKVKSIRSSFACMHACITARFVSTICLPVFLSGEKRSGASFLLVIAVEESHAGGGRSAANLSFRSPLAGSRIQIGQRVLSAHPDH